MKTSKRQSGRISAKFAGMTMLLAVAVGLTLGASSAYSNVIFIDSILNDASAEVSEWSKTSLSKSFDIDGDNYYGSDGFAWMNASNEGTIRSVLYSLNQTIPDYTGGIAYAGTGDGISASNSPADDRLDTNGAGSVNVGYAGANHAGTTGATDLQALFSYTMNRDMVSQETIRLGVVLDSYAEDILGADSLRVVAGGSTADATGLNRTGVMDMYFFDISGLNSGETIEIWGANSTESDNANWNAVTIGGVTFDSAVIPEPASLGLLALVGGLLWFVRRRVRA